jgi:hypothetical protein
MATAGRSHLGPVVAMRSYCGDDVLRLLTREGARLPMNVLQLPESELALLCRDPLPHHERHMLHTHAQSHRVVRFFSRTHGLRCWPSWPYACILCIGTAQLTLAVPCGATLGIPQSTGNQHQPACYRETTEFDVRCTRLEPQHITSHTKSMST